MMFLVLTAFALTIVSALKVSLSEKMGTCPVAGAGMRSSMALLWRRQQHSMILTHFEGV